MNDLTADEQPLLLRFRHRSSPLPLTSEPLGSPTRNQSPPTTLFLEIHPDDAARMHIADGDRIVASAPTATIRAIVRIHQQVSVGTALLSMSDPSSESTQAPVDSPRMRSPNIAQVMIRPA